MRTQGAARSPGRQGHALSLFGGASAFSWRTLGGVTGQDQRVLGFLVALVRCVAARKCCGSAGEDGED